MADEKEITPGIKIIVKSVKLDKAYGELSYFVEDLCEKYELNYYQLFGLLETLKFNYNDELKEQEY